MKKDIVMNDNSGDEDALLSLLTNHEMTG